MKVILLNTYLKGGAGIACQRLAHALNKNRFEADILVQEPTTGNPRIHSTSTTYLTTLLSKARLAKELSYFIINEKDKEDRFKFSVAKSGIDISDMDVVRDANIIHLHWINQGFLSLASIKKLGELKKPIVWTLHDMWAFTGGCHYSGGCLNFMTECHHCPYLRNPSSHDLSNKTWKRKLRLLEDLDITFVCCSDWLKNIAQRSSLLQKFRIESIPNPIDTDLFSPIESIEARRKWNLPIDKKLILFGAMNISDPRKGFEYLSNALNFLAAENPESIQNIEIVVFGSANQDLNLNLPYKVNNLGLISSTNDLINVYSSSDVFVLPSLEDNLPNTIMESLECETPVVAFNSGGIPEMIDHCNNGFLAEYKSSKSLAEGIEFVLNHTNKEQLKYNSRKKILSNYQEKIIAEKYEMLYKSL